jgi:hypothetical protein
MQMKIHGLVLKNKSLFPIYSSHILVILQTVPLPADNVQPSLNERWEIIAQPYCTTKVRYRTDYQPPSTRRHPLKNKNPESSFTGPAIRVRHFDYFDFSRKTFLL